MACKSTHNAYVVILSFKRAHFRISSWHTAALV